MSVSASLTILFLRRDCLTNRCPPTIHRSHHPQLPLYHSQLKTHLLTKPSHRKHSPCRQSTRTMVAAGSVKHTRFFAFLVLFRYIFTAQCYASAVLAMALCLSVCPSVTSRSSTRRAKRRITQTTPPDSPGTLVFSCLRSPRNSTEVTPYEGAKRRWLKWATFDK